MPLYEYRCTSCGDLEERIEAFGAPETHDCPECGVKNGMHRLLSTASFALSGGGWYREGYGNGAGPKAESPAPAAGAAGGCCAGSCPHKA